VRGLAPLHRSKQLAGKQHGGGHPSPAGVALRSSPGRSPCSDSSHPRCTIPARSAQELSRQLRMSICQGLGVWIVNSGRLTTAVRGENRRNYWCLSFLVSGVCTTVPAVAWITGHPDKQKKALLFSSHLLPGTNQNLSRHPHLQTPFPRTKPTEQRRGGERWRNKAERESRAGDQKE
jgi:hypothetical protein